MRPFLKWAGNKYNLRERILALLPPGQRLIEPFVGSGAVFLNSHYPRYWLADQNTDLMAVYQALQEEGESFIETCRTYFTTAHNQRAVFFELREVFNHCANTRQRAALFVYLNRHGYNGLCRYNQKGGFNVPFGQYRQPYFPEAEMRAAVHKLQNPDCPVALTIGDFRSVMAQACFGDVVYCDPPYVPLSVTAGFTQYAAGGFGLAEQRALADLALELSKRGIPVLISNHHTPDTVELYQGAEQFIFPVRRMISCKGEGRQPVDEILALFSSNCSSDDCLQEKMSLQENELKEKSIINQ